MCEVCAYQVLLAKNTVPAADCDRTSNILWTLFLSDVLNSEYLNYYYISKLSHIEQHSSSYRPVISGLATHRAVKAAGSCQRKLGLTGHPVNHPANPCPALVSSAADSNRRTEGHRWLFGSLYEYVTKLHDMRGSMIPLLLALRIPPAPSPPHPVKVRTPPDPQQSGSHVPVAACKLGVRSGG